MRKSNLFQRRHYQAMAEGMAQMAKALENIEAECMLGLPDGKKLRLKSRLFAATMDAMCDIFAADNPQFKRKVFEEEFNGCLTGVLHKMWVDKRSVPLYTVVDETSSIKWEELK